jgi:hypothetical protein
MREKEPQTGPMKAASETIYSLRDRLLVMVERQNHLGMASPRNGRGFVKHSG